MTVYGLQVEVAVGNDTGEGALQRLAVAFERSGPAIANLGKYVFPRLSPVFEEAVKEQFDARGEGPVAGSWADLTPDYAAWKATAYPGQPLLERTGALRAALTSSGSPVALRAWSDTDFTFGSNGVEYASFHQTGTGKMVARPVFDFGPSFEAEMTRATSDGVREAIKDASNGLIEVTP